MVCTLAREATLLKSRCGVRRRACFISIEGRSMCLMEVLKRGRHLPDTYDKGNENTFALAKESRWLDWTGMLRRHSRVDQQDHTVICLPTTSSSRFAWCSRTLSTMQSLNHKYQISHHPHLVTSHCTLFFQMHITTAIYT